MKSMRAHLFKRVNRQEAEREVENELLFHLELLTEEYLRSGMTLDEAGRAALKRFGNVERVKNQCIEISKRSRPMMRVLKSFLVVIFLAGVLASALSADIYGKQIGNMFMAIAALGGLLVYLRGLRFSGFVAEAENSSPLGLSDNEQIFMTANDRKELTPLERIINDD